MVDLFDQLGSHNLCAAIVGGRGCMHSGLEHGIFVHRRAVASTNSVDEHCLWNFVFHGNGLRIHHFHYLLELDLWSKWVFAYTCAMCITSIVFFYSRNTHIGSCQLSSSCLQHFINDFRSVNSSPPSQSQTFVRYNRSGLGLLHIHFYLLHSRWHRHLSKALDLSDHWLGTARQNHSYCGRCHHFCNCHAFCILGIGKTKAIYIQQGVRWTHQCIAKWRIRKSGCNRDWTKYSELQC